MLHVVSDLSRCRLCIVHLFWSCSLIFVLSHIPAFSALMLLVGRQKGKYSFRNPHGFSFGGCWVSDLWNVGQLNKKKRNRNLYDLSSDRDRVVSACWSCCNLRLVLHSLGGDYLQASVILLFFLFVQFLEVLMHFWRSVMAESLDVPFSESPRQDPCLCSGIRISNFCLLLLIDSLFNCWLIILCLLRLSRQYFVPTDVKHSNVLLIECSECVCW